MSCYYTGSLIIFPLIIVLLTIPCKCEKFPEGFLLGTASSAYQIEGGHDADGKGESIWDYYTNKQSPSLFHNSSNGNIACDSYHKYKDDVALLKELGVDFYRFSLSWSRILPTGHVNQINPMGIAYYNNLIDELLRNGIQPMATMYHWDLPKTLQNLGGWANPLMADYFEAYARVLFDNFGDRVKLWITFNANSLGYGDEFCPPFLGQSGIAEYLYVNGIIRAHAQTYHMYQREFQAKQLGKIGITIDGRWYEPATSSLEDVAAAERAVEFNVGLFANPIFGNGDYPEVVKERVANRSRLEGFAKSRLPPLPPAASIRGAFDFLGVNIYTAFLASEGVEMDTLSFANDVKVRVSQDVNWPKSASDWLRSTPWALRKMLAWIKRKYNNPDVYVTENGFSDEGQLDDGGRIDFLEAYMRSLLDSIREDGVRVQGYAVWSLLDNFEWLSGYREKFGLFSVDFNDPSRRRLPKSSAKWYKKLLASRELPQKGRLDRAEL